MLVIIKLERAFKLSKPVFTVSMSALPNLSMALLPSLLASP